MNLAKLCILFVIISSVLFTNNQCCYYEDCQGYKTKTSSKQSEFNHGNDNYKLVVNVIDKYNDFHISHSLNVSYEVYKNGQLINNKVKEDNNIQGDCDYINGGRYSIELIDNKGYIGWILYSPIYCGATSSADWATIIIPSKEDDNYLKSKISIMGDVFKYYPTAEGLDFYYYKQDWGSGGTWSSIYVPYKLSYNANKNIIYPKNIKIEDLENLEYIYFLSVFISGFESLDKELMQYALDQYYRDDNLDWYEGYFGSHFNIEEIDWNAKYLTVSDCSRENLQNIINRLYQN